MAHRLVERVLERVAQRVGRRPAWGGVERTELLGGDDRASGSRPGLASEEFWGAWGRTPLRDRGDPDPEDEQAEYPGFGGTA